jgi:hypothetical protein
MTNYQNSYYFECECHSDEHIFKFTLDKDDADFYLSVFLNNPDRWYKRVWKAIKYMMGYKCKYGHWDSTMLDLEDVIRLRDLCDKVIDHKEPVA